MIDLGVPHTQRKDIVSTQPLHWNFRNPHTPNLRSSTSHKSSPDPLFIFFLPESRVFHQSLAVFHIFQLFETFNSFNYMYYKPRKVHLGCFLLQLSWQFAFDNWKKIWYLMFPLMLTTHRYCFHIINLLSLSQNHSEKKKVFCKMETFELPSNWWQWGKWS